LKYVIKRCMDILLSTSVLVLLSPVLVFIAVAIRLDSSGPVLFRQRRMTKNGVIFVMYKFRTMVENAEHMHTGLFSYDDDFRVTRVGRFLRRTSLDELPQLLNVIRGEMSIVGPRPPVSYELGPYEDLNEEYRKRFSVLPGITGLAQVSGRNELAWDEKIRFDNLYVDLFSRYGVLIDLRIILMTVLSVVSGRGIIESRGGSCDTCSDGELAATAASAVLEKAREKSEPKHRP